MFLHTDDSIKGGKVIGETSIEIERISDAVRQSSGHSNVIKLPLTTGEFFVKENLFKLIRSMMAYEYEFFEIFC